MLTASLEEIGIVLSGSPMVGSYNFDDAINRARTLEHEKPDFYTLEQKAQNEYSLRCKITNWDLLKQINDWVKKGEGEKPN